MTMAPRIAARRGMSLGTMCLALSLWQGIDCSFAMERVRFESARYLVGPLQLRLARERGEAVQRPAATAVDGYLSKPDGDGPFPAVVILHGCTGLSEEFKSGARSHPWVDQLVAWGYVALVVDSFTARGVQQTCSQIADYRVADAHGSLAFLSRQPFVHPDRVAVMGFSAGGFAVLSAVEQRDFDLYEGEDDRKFAAAIALYPNCSRDLDGDFTTPTLILNGELDDWSPASACRSMMARRKGRGNAAELIAYPDAHHSFDVVSLQPGMRIFGHWVEYNANAAAAATREVHRFLAEKLAN